MADGFRYLSPWLPMKDGWYRLGHVGPVDGGRIHRWRLYKAHERNVATGERWERWRLFYDWSTVQFEGTVCLTWSGSAELSVEVRDRGHAGELVLRQFALLCEGAPHV